MSVLQVKDKKSTNFNNNTLTTLYYYLLSMSDKNDLNVKPYGYVDTVQSISYCPFIDKNTGNVIVHETDFDKSFYGLGGDDTPKVWRLIYFHNIDIPLGSLDLGSEYNNAMNNNEESKLYLYPYRYFVLTDYVNQPLLLKPQHINLKNGLMNVNVYLTLNQSSKYCIYPVDYKRNKDVSTSNFPLGFDSGKIEGIVNNTPMLSPVMSSQYSAWLTSQGNTFNATNTLSLMENEIQHNFGVARGTMNFVGGLMNTGLGLFSGNLTSGTGFGVGNGVVQMGSGAIDVAYSDTMYKQKEYEVQTMALAKKQDYLNAPRTIKTMGNDYMFSCGLAKNRIDVIEYGLTPQRQWRLNDYFVRYGYKTNEYSIPNIKSRRYFNFIKTIDCNIDSASIPHEDIQKLQQIFNSGVTVWHVDNGATVKDYYVNNSEVE